MFKKNGTHYFPVHNKDPGAKQVNTYDVAYGVKGQPFAQSASSDLLTFHWHLSCGGLAQAHSHRYHIVHSKSSNHGHHAGSQQPAPAHGKV